MKWAYDRFVTLLQNRKEERENKVSERRFEWICRATGVLRGRYETSKVANKKEPL